MNYAVLAHQSIPKALNTLITPTIFITDRPFAVLFTLNQIRIIQIKKRIQPDDNVRTFRSVIGSDNFSGHRNPVNCLPSTPTPQSNTSTLHFHDVKKSRSFISPNRFAVLTSNDTCSDNVFDAPYVSHNTEHQVDEPVPPIYVKHITHSSAFKDIFVKITSPNGFICKLIANYLCVCASFLSCLYKDIISNNLKIFFLTCKNA